MLNLLVAGVGLGISAYGAYEKNQASKASSNIAAAQAAIQQQQNQLQIEAKKQQQIIADTQYQQSKDTLQTNLQQIGLQQKAEDVRQNAMNLDATRQKRQTVRNLITTQAANTAAAVGQGVSLGDTSVTGGRAQTQAQGYGNILNVNQAATSGNKLFGINRDITDIQTGLQQRALGYLDTTYAAETNIRGIQNQSYALSGYSNQLSAQNTKYIQKAAEGSALMSLGSGISGNSSSISNVGTQLYGLF